MFLTDVQGEDYPRSSDNQIQDKLQLRQRYVFQPFYLSQTFSSLLKLQGHLYEYHGCCLQS